MLNDKNIIFSVSLLRTPFIGPITNEDGIVIITSRIRINWKNCSLYLPIYKKLPNSRNKDNFEEYEEIERKIDSIFIQAFI